MTVNLAPLFKSLGLEYVNVCFRKWRSNAASFEKPKIILTGSVWRAVSRNIIHVLPIAVLAVLIWINYGTFFIGPSFIEDPEKNTYFLAAIQICAKLEELLCIASLTAILLHALRHELLGDGVRIGLLGSGIWFSSLSAFWSPEFLSSFSWAWPSWRKLRFYALLAICGAIAATIGPASAILMLPRLQTFPAGGASFYMNGTADELWPSVVTAASEPDACGYPNATLYAVCPSGGYGSLSQTYSRFTYHDLCTAQGCCRARTWEGNRQWFSFLIQSPSNLVPPLINGWRGSTWGSRGVSAVQPHAASVIIMSQLRDEWAKAAQTVDDINIRQYKWTYDLQTLGSSTSPFVRTKCSLAQNLSASADTALFYSMTRPNTSDITDWAGLNHRSIADLDRNETTQIRTQWLPSSTSSFDDPLTNFHTAGLLIELPWSQGSRAAIGCAIAAAWHNITVRSARSTTFSGWNVALSPDDYLDRDDSPDAVNTNRPVALDDGWLRLLTPTSPETPTLNSLENILTNLRFSRIPEDIRTYTPLLCTNASVVNLTDTDTWNHPACALRGFGFVEAIVASMVADGLSRFGSHRAIHVDSWFQVQPALQWRTPMTFNRTRVLAASTKRNTHTPALEANLASQWITIDAVGYAYYPSSASDYLALVGVCVYLAVALTYILYTTIRRPHLSSNAWDSVTELLVLCQNSPPPTTSHQLDNASAGIEQLETYRTVVKVRAKPAEDGLAHPSVRLVLDTDAGEAEPAAVQVVDSGSKDPMLKSSTVELTVTSHADPVPAGVTTLGMISPSASRFLRLRRIEKDEKYT